MDKKNKITFLAVLGIGLFLIGGSYALWQATINQTLENKIGSSCFNLSLTNEQNNIHLQNAYPIYDEDGKKLTPYSFTITNTCDLFASYTVNLEMLEGSNLPIQYIRSMVNKEEIKNLSELETGTKSVTSSTDSRVLAKGSLGSGDSEDYTLRLWIDENVTLNDTDAIGKILKSKVVITGTVSTFSPCEQGFCKLNEALLVNEYQTISLDIAKERIQNKQTVDFVHPAPIVEWQESHESTASRTEAIMPHPDLVGQHGVTSVEQTQVKLGKNYTFDKVTGRYNLTDILVADPTTINYNDGNNYYFCSAGTNISASDVLNPYQNYQNCTSIYKVSKASQEDSILTSTNGTIFKGVKYTLEVYKYNQIELESDKSDKGLYIGTDDYGDTYYYRGSVKNNYVKFNDMYWRIIRVNGDGSIRMIYAGTTGTATGEGLKIGSSAFNTARDKTGYVGYMYGNIEGSTVDEIYANTNSSTMKEYLENWYQTNIEAKGLSSLISDSGFCNDRTITLGDGVSTSIQTNYGPVDRWNKKTPSLVCPNKERDLFTTSTSAVGNKASQYPIGLITVDELTFAGMANGYLNKLSYVFSSEWYWTMSPSYFIATRGTANEFNLSGGGDVYGHLVTSMGGVRPVINLSKDTEITGGIGTSNNPFVVKIS